MRSSWSRAICYDLVPKKHGPVAQRLEQGTHNLAFCPRRRFHRWTVSEQTRRVATENDGHSVNITSMTSRVGGNGNRESISLSRGQSTYEKHWNPVRDPNPCTSIERVLASQGEISAVAILLPQIAEFTLLRLQLYPGVSRLSGDANRRLLRVHLFSI